MLRFAGEGANLAMIDGTDFGLAIVSGEQSGNHDTAVKDFEVSMFERARPLAAGENSARNIDICISKDNAAANTAKRRLPSPPGSLVVIAKI
jgi:hypothetical protein